MKRNIGSILGGLAAAALLLGGSGCGLERILIVDLSGDPGIKTPPPPPLTGEAVRGAFGISFTTAPTISVFGQDGQPIAGVVTTPTTTGYEAQFPDNDYANLTVVAQQNGVVLELVVPALTKVGVTNQITNADLNADSTAIALVLQGLAGRHGNEFRQLQGSFTTATIAALQTAVASPGPMASLRDAVTRVIAAAAASTEPSLRTPVLDMAGNTVTSAISDTWLATATVDLDGVGGNDTTSVPFDALLLAAIESVPVCADPDILRVIFATNFNSGLKDGNCAIINQFKWVTASGDKHMYFTGGAPYQTLSMAPQYAIEMGNWTPNIVSMYDDGTHGDQTPNDNIWTISFDLPKDLKVGYKYTWGTEGAGWTGCEEWPGNQRLLQIVDVNGDGFVYRLDNFADEATNKDKVNGYLGGYGSLCPDCRCPPGETRPSCLTAERLAAAHCDQTVKTPTTCDCGDTCTWETDANHNGISDSEEQKIDTTNACPPANLQWITPDWIGPVLKYCPT